MVTEVTVRIRRSLRPHGPCSSASRPARRRASALPISSPPHHSRWHGDEDRPAIHAAEDFVQAGYPLDVEALLLVELDGPGAEVDHLIGQVEAIAARNGCTTSRVSQNDAERLSFWAGRKAAFPAVGRISPDYYCMDGTIPRKELPRVLAGMRALSEKYGLGVANVFHAGDGNLHPLILYDANKPGELESAEAFGADILRLCVEVGGVLTGEHGVGVEKRDLMPEMYRQGRPRPADTGQMRLRPQPSAQPGQGVSAASPLRRARAHAYSPRPGAVPGHPPGSELESKAYMPYFFQSDWRTEWQRDRHRERAGYPQEGTVAASRREAGPEDRGRCLAGRGDFDQGGSIQGGWDKAYGILADETDKVATIEEMNEAIAKGWADFHESGGGHQPSRPDRDARRRSPVAHRFRSAVDRDAGRHIASLPLRTGLAAAQRLRLRSRSTRNGGQVGDRSCKCRPTGRSSMPGFGSRPVAILPTALWQVPELPWVRMPSFPSTARPSRFLRR